MGSSNCTRCAAPQFTSAEGAPACVSCDVGKYRVFTPEVGDCLAAPCFGAACVSGEIVAKEDFYVYYDSDGGGGVRRSLADEVVRVNCSECKGGSQGPCVDWTSGYCLDYAPGTNGSCPPASLPCYLSRDGGGIRDASSAPTPTEGQCSSGDDCWPWSTGDCVDFATTLCRPVAADTRECLNGTSFCEAGAARDPHGAPVEFETTVALFLADARNNATLLTDRSSAAGTFAREALRCAVADMAAVSCERVSLLSISYMVTGAHESRRLLQGQGDVARVRRLSETAEQSDVVFVTFGFDFSQVRVHQETSASTAAVAGHNSTASAASKAFSAAHALGDPEKASLLRAALSASGVEYHGRGAFVAMLPTPKPPETVEECNCECNEGVTSTVATEAGSTTTTAIPVESRLAPGLELETIGALAAAGVLFVGVVIAITIAVVRSAQARRKWNRQTSSPIAAHAQKPHVNSTSADMEAQGTER